MKSDGKKVFDVKKVNFTNKELTNHSSVGGIVLDNSGRVCMLFHKKMNRWTIPVGKINKDERPGDALDRELQEELGIQVISKKKIIVKKLKFFFKSRQTRIEIHIYKVMEYVGTPKNKATDEHKYIKFFTKDELMSMPREDVSEFTWLWLQTVKDSNSFY